MKNCLLAGIIAALAAVNVAAAPAADETSAYLFHG